MKKTIRVTAKKVEDAISQGLEILGVTIDEAEIVVISTGGLFKKAEVEISIGTDDEPMQGESNALSQEKPVVSVQAKPMPTKQERPAKQEKPAKQDKPAPTKQETKQETKQDKQPQKPAKPQDAKQGKSVPLKQGQAAKQQERARREPRPSAPATPELQQAAEAFLNRTLSLAGIEASVKSDTTDGLSMVVETEDSIVIGHRGETLDALQYLTSLIVNGGPNKYVAVTVDALGYRGRRAESLQRLAQKMADKCITQNRRVSLESMNNSDRKEIHAFLADNDKVVTRSEGNEPNRRVVIYPAK